MKIRFLIVMLFLWYAMSGFTQDPQSLQGSAVQEALRQSDPEAFHLKNGRRLYRSLSKSETVDSVPPSEEVSHLLKLLQKQNKLNFRLLTVSVLSGVLSIPSLVASIHLPFFLLKIRTCRRRHRSQRPYI